MHESNDLETLERTLAYTFEDRSLLEIALTHPSYSAEHPRCVQHNQRLEFLGDAVLQLAVTDILYRHHPDAAEGQLTKLRAAMTNDDTLAVFADHLNLGKYVFLGKGENDAGGRNRPSTMSDAFEAVLGAVYLDGGFDPALRLCRRLSTHVMAQREQIITRINPKGTLQEIIQQRFQQTPVYETTHVSGPEHNPRFTVVVKLGSQILGTGKAGNRKNAEKHAAENALVEIQQEQPTR